MATLFGKELLNHKEVAENPHPFYRSLAAISHRLGCDATRADRREHFQFKGGLERCSLLVCIDCLKKSPWCWLWHDVGSGSYWLDKKRAQTLPNPFVERNKPGFAVRMFVIRLGYCRIEDLLQSVM